MGLPAIKLGLVGAIATTAMSVLNPLLKQTRLQLAEVYDPSLAAAQENAHLLDAASSPSLDGLLRRCQGVVIGEVRWMGLEPILRAIEFQKPVLILESVISQLDAEQLRSAQSAAENSRTLLMPDLSFRWARSTLRLRELTATQAGAIEWMELNCLASPGDHNELLVLDWCGNVMQSECRSVFADPADGSILLSYRRLNRSGSPVTARIHFTSVEAPASFAVSNAKIECRHGTIRLDGEEKLNWEIDRKKISESLVSDRSASDVMFDLFGRRLVGGLVPIPEVSDLIRAHALRSACQLSRETKQEAFLTP